MCKFRVGNFEGWLLGKQVWVVKDRRTGAVVGSATNMSDCCKKAERLHNEELMGG
jgi:hypothetical protein